MHNINLVFTRHDAYGNCNSNALYKIIESIRPEIIFEELSVPNYLRAYIEERLTTLETTAIKMYLLDHPINHLPIDTYVLPKSYDENIDSMYNRLLDNNAHGQMQNLRSLLDDQMIYISKYGFRYLNSIYNDELLGKFILLKEQVLNQLKDERLLKIYATEKEVNEKREDEMLTNIYQYSKENQYRQGLFFIGSGHRESMIKKTIEFNEINELKLNWILHDPESF